MLERMLMDMIDASQRLEHVDKAIAATCQASQNAVNDAQPPVLPPPLLDILLIFRLHSMRFLPMRRRDFPKHTSRKPTKVSTPESPSSKTSNVASGTFSTRINRHLKTGSPPPSPRTTLLSTRKSDPSNVPSLYNFSTNPSKTSTVHMYTLWTRLKSW